MPVKTPEDYLLNATYIGERYMAHLNVMIDGFGLHNVRQLVKKLPEVPPGLLATAFAFGEVKLRNTCATLGGNQGNFILTRITLYLHNKYEIHGNNHGGQIWTPLIAPLVNTTPFQLADVPHLKFLVQFQRYHLQALAEAIEMIAAIVLFNHDLIKREDIAYDYPIQLSDPLIHPGAVVCRAAFYLRSLLNAINHANDMADAQAVHDLQNMNIDPQPDEAA